jgi:hypothetical protein
VAKETLDGGNVDGSFVWNQDFIASKKFELVEAPSSGTSINRIPSILDILNSVSGLLQVVYVAKDISHGNDFGSNE